MSKCPACGHELPAGSRFCPVCAEPLAAPVPADDATPVPPAGDETPVPPAGDLTPNAPATAAPPSSLAPDEPRFVPGTVLAGRYRIVGLLGRGGMGEVYRADDLKLGQSIALKFLPQGLDQDPERLQRFLGEVKVALKITHPNVCRVYDIGEVDLGAGGLSAHYLSMEYIDGEDLSSLLRRIGRLPEDKAIQIARQLCAGLAAAHEQGILHRDLKPANVMLDGRGDVRITDFGLAGLAEGFTGAEIRAGTPAFMAPEQLAGKEVTARSDIYSLGLVLYELFTGQRALRGDSLAEISRLQQTGLTSPSSHVSVLDPAVEQVILRCLAPEPADRPASVVKVALGLPGADPLAAALAAGETPSPEMVAEAGDDAALAPRWAVPLMVFSILGLLAYAWIAGRTHLLGRVPLELPPQAMVYRAQEMVEALGYDDRPADHAYSFQTDRPYLRHLAEDPSPDRWQRLSDQRPSAIYLWYRQSPRPMVPQNILGRVFFSDPPVRLSGMVNLYLDAAGRLAFLKAVPPQHEAAPAGESREPAAGEPTAGTAPAEDSPAEEPAAEEPAAEEPAAEEPAAPAVELLTWEPTEGSQGAPWPIAFEAAGLELDRFAAVTPEWLPEAYCNQRAAWTGTYPGQAKPELRVEACAYNGKLVFFSIIHPWDRASRQQQADQSTTELVKIWVAGIAFLSILIGAALLVRRNLRLGRGDRRGAWRLAAWTVASSVAAWFFHASHVANLGEFFIFIVSMGNMLFVGALVWALYIALEPFVRRRWPESLVSWSRLLAGRIRDPLVGRHMLYGAALAVGVGLLDELGRMAPTFFGDAGPTPSGNDFDTLMGTRWVLGEVFFTLRQVILMPMIVLFLLVLLRVLLRNSWVALAVFVAIFALLGFTAGKFAVIGIVTNAIIFTAFGLCIMRFGLVAFMSASLVNTLNNQPLSLDLSTWYAGNTLTMLAAGVAFIVTAFRISLGGRPLFSEDE